MTVLLNSEIFILTLVIGVVSRCCMVVQKNKTEYPESVVGIYTRIGADHSFPGDFPRVVWKKEAG